MIKTNSTIFTHFRGHISHRISYRSNPIRNFEVRLESSFSTIKNKKMEPTTNDTIVRVDWLAENLNKKNVKVLDASWALSGPNMRQQFEKEHIPGAKFFDIDDIADKSTNLPHMLPKESDFDFAMANFGISNADHVVVYDRSGMYVASARAWWTFKAFGHNNVSVLEGGLSNWKKKGNEVENGPSSGSGLPSMYRARLQPQLVQNMEQMLDNIKNKRQILDARSSGRFTAKDPEPRQGLRGGHMPGSKNLPFGDILIKTDPSNDFLSFLPPDQLKAAFEKAGVDPSKPIAMTCGTGVTASVLALGAHLLNNKSYSVYDGSWTEWAAQPADKTPVVGADAAQSTSK